MRKGLVSILMAISWTLALVPVAAAGEYHSGFGFGISVPEVYLVLTREEVRKNAALFLDADEESRFRRIPTEMRRQVYDRVEAGELEIFYRTQGVDLSFVDNVNIMVQTADLPRGPEQVAEVCRILPGEFSRMFRRPIGLDGCEMRVVAGQPALYLAFDGAMPGTKTLQYQIQQSAGETVIITATASDGTVSRMMGEFEQMVASIRAR